MKKPRRLGDLYVRGKDLSIDDGFGPVEIRLQKLNEIDRDSVMRRANAAKARFLVDADDEDSEVFQSMYAQIRDFQLPEGLVSLIIAPDAQRARARAEAQIAGDPETWAKDGYLQGLVGAWFGDDDNPGLVATLAEDPDDPEVKRVKAEVERFDEEVSARVAAEVADLEANWADRSEEEVWRAATRAMLIRVSDDAFAREYHRQQIFHAVRDPKDHSKRYFGSVAEVDDLDEKLRSFLNDQYEVLSVDAAEGKDLGASPDSSNSSVPAEETSVPSGLEVVNV